MTAPEYPDPDPQGGDYADDGPQDTPEDSDGEDT